MKDAGLDGAVARVRVRIAGEEYVIRGDAPPAHIEKIADVVDRKLRQLREQHRNLPFHRLALLAAIHLADELEKARAQVQELLALVEEHRARAR